ncbi:unnamed protein product [Adineta ricciae]|uniref:ubiquitinyl hydrolase 1 n=1 Tax=Adineta ricciae TaxID=249248 RepID=A0A815KQD4_ADIRI|nr:unnamed protein product [Adineta ricciae]
MPRFGRSRYRIQKPWKQYRPRLTFLSGVASNASPTVTSFVKQFHNDNKSSVPKSTTKDDSIVHHLFLPCKLPNSADSDYLIGNDHKNEYELLESFIEFIESLKGKFHHTVFADLIRYLRRWAFLQDPNKLSNVNLQETIKQLVPGDILPLYLHYQNAAILIEIENRSGVEHTLISAWQVQLSTKNVTSSLLPHFSCFPVPVYELPDRSELQSKAHCELLIDLMQNPLEHNQTHRVSGLFDETRDITVSHYVTDWWISHFSGIRNGHRSISLISFNKKHRDQIRWKDALLPFRRSGLWMTMKTVVQTILIKRLGKLGTIVYKFLITYFLTSTIHKRQTSITDSKLDVDLLMHCSRKIVRRLNKIDHLRSTIEDKDLFVWVNAVMEEITLRLGEIIPYSTWQFSIQKSRYTRGRLSTMMVDVDRLQTYQHSCQQLKSYLSASKQHFLQQQPSINYGQNTSMLKDLEINDELPSPTILTCSSTYTDDAGLMLVEIWIETRLQQWTNRLLSAENDKTHFKKLLELFEVYQTKALEHYSNNQQTDGFGYSRYILTSLTILRCMHQKLCSDQRFQRLSFHDIEIPHLLELFEYLILPTQEDMIRARQLYDYFLKFTQKPYPELLNGIERSNAFGVHYASQSEEMKQTLREIQAEAERDKLAKRQEFNAAKQRYNTLQEEAKSLECECEFVEEFFRGQLRRYKRKCRRCKLIEEANSIRVEYYECPIPENEKSALAVVFELQMPIEFRCYREILWQFVSRLNSNASSHLMHEWLNSRPHSSKLSKFLTDRSNWKVKLVSSWKSFSETHYSRQFSSWTSVDEFLQPNHLQVRINRAESTTFENECRILTAQLEDPNYKLLQFTIDKTCPLKQNKVITESVRCPLALRSTEFIEFGSFRLGHRLQWWHLLSALELDSLSFDEESVLLLITHSITQHGPVTNDTSHLSHPWCPESHRALLDDDFLDELLLRLDRRLDDCRSNWQNELTFLLMTIIIMRILTICNETKHKRLIELALKCREIGQSSMGKISNIFRTTTSINIGEMQKLRDKIVIIASACLFTFSLYPKFRLLSDSSVVSLLTATTAIHDNNALNKSPTRMSIFMRNLIRWKNYILLKLGSTILPRYLHESSYQSLHQFAVIHWGPLKTKQITNGQWQKRITKNFDGWYDGQYQSIKISIDCLQGKFLVNGMSIGFLPGGIASSDLFRRTFGEHVFEVQPGASPNTYVTKHAYHNNQVHYEFRSNGLFCNNITIRATYQTGEVFQLIPKTNFQSEFATKFVENYSHWINQTTNVIQFRPIHFQDAQFLTNISYALDLNNGFLIRKNMKKVQILINHTSSVFQNLFKLYFRRLDTEAHVYMFRDDAYPILRTKQMPLNCLVHIHLPRLGLAFEYDAARKKILSREYSGMYIAENQCFETLTGLKAGLLLSPTVSGATNRKLLVPFGQVQAKKTLSSDHQFVFIDRDAKMSFAHQYFVFILNDRLRILQSSDSPTGWLYLALLHALTSHTLPDVYTGMTGMERAFQLLYSAGCWTDQPFDSLSLDIAHQIAKISPKVQYYPSHLRCMETIQWNEQSIPYSLQHFGYYLIIKKLIESSEQLSFMYSSSESVTSALPSNNINLLEKLYMDYRDSYNPTARLSDEMEKGIIFEPKLFSYEPTPAFDSGTTDNSIYRPSEDLYKSGDLHLEDPSTIHCFPLREWIKRNGDFKTIFVGLLKLIERAKMPTNNNRSDEIGRLDILFNFLHYISKKCSIRPFYLNMFRTLLKDNSIILVLLVFPPFGSYRQIEQIQVHRDSITLYPVTDEEKRAKIFAEMEESFRQNLPYTDQLKLLDNEFYKNRINELFALWRLNKKLQDFIKHIEQIMDSIKYTPIVRIRIGQLQITREIDDKHHQIQVRSANVPVDPLLLLSAYRKYCCHSSDNLVCLKQSTRIFEDKMPFPEQIFPSTSSHENPFSDITKFFKQQLRTSWQKFQSEERFQYEYLSIRQINRFLYSTRQESAQLWKELIRLIRTSNELLFDTGLALRMTPSILVSLLHEIWLNDNEHKHNKPSNPTKKQKVQQPERESFLTPERCILLGGILVNWTVEQRLQRIIHCANQNQKEDFEKEASNIPHVNWIPSEHVPWLILELEMNITIRDVQVKVARHMMDPNRLDSEDNQVRNTVMQMNMGEGKTSVIIPMLALSLCSSTSSLVRIIVLKSLLTMNYQSLRSKLGGLLNRRVFPFTCRRDMKFGQTQVEQIDRRLRQGMSRRDIVLTAPEYILSFDLLTIDKCRRQEFTVGEVMLKVQQWTKRCVRDVLDESDEILHVKYQLIYTIGQQKPVSGGAQRWKTIQLALELVKKNAELIAQDYPKDVLYEKPLRSSHFSSFRLLSREPFRNLAKRVAKDWLNEQPYRQEERQLLSSVILESTTSTECLQDRFSQEILQRILILRGLLSSEVLFQALTKRYRVNFGVNHDRKFNRLMAVPFRAKDVAAENTEFGHPDIAIVLTQLYYYYDGLTGDQLSKCFKRLSDVEKHPGEIYHEWVLYENDDCLDPSIKTWEGINLKDDQQRTLHLFPTFRKNMLVINYFLNHFVFPQEAKQFPEKLVSSPWDLSTDRRAKILTGFSGTNDTQLLLPIHICQHDLPELVKTDAVVLNNLLRQENEFYQSLPINIKVKDIIEKICSDQQRIQVVLDVGALFVNGSNRQIAIQWLEKSNLAEIDYAVYFQSDSLYVCDRQNQHHSFANSPASERLERCVFYLDEVHTRGTDFKFPKGFRAVVTLGNGSTKDRFVQACMRMRKLGHGHSLSFYSSHEVDQRIRLLKETADENESIALTDVLRWIYENTQQATWNGLHHWATQSLSYQRKLAAFQNIQWADEQQHFSPLIMRQFPLDCTEQEIIELHQMYGMSKSMQKIADIHRSRSHQLNFQLSPEINTLVLNRLNLYGGTTTILAHAFDEEQERELEREIEQEVEEERQQERPTPPVPHRPILHEEIKKLANHQSPMMNLAQLSSVFCSLPQAFLATTFASHSQPSAWKQHLWISKEFQSVIETRGESLDAFLRPPRWIVVYRQEYIIFLSPYEANCLIDLLQHSYQQYGIASQPTTTLRLFLPRLKRNQSILINTPTLSVPSSSVTIPNDWLAPLFVFNGTLYFSDVEEQRIYCHFLGICPNPRLEKDEQNAFEKGWIDNDGFIQNSEHRRHLQMNQCHFTYNPLNLVRKILENRLKCHIPVRSHVGSLILNTKKALV